MGWAGKLGLVLAGLVGLSDLAIADVKTQSAFYLAAGLGGRNVSNEDANSYFDGTPYGFSKTSFTSAFAPVFDLALGYQSDSLFGLELGATGGPNRGFDVTYNNSANTPVLNAKDTWTVAGVYVMPTLRLFRPTGVLEKPAFQTVGLRIGRTYLDGTLEASNKVNGQSGKYKQAGSTTAFGVAYRFQQMFTSQFDLGIEIAYDRIVFDEITTKDGSGVYANIKSPDTNADNSKAVVDVSGLSLRLIFSGWFSTPARP